MNIETAQATRLGDRRENQDRAAILIGDTRVLLVVADGMGGHADGAAAAQAAIDSLSRSFKALRRRDTASFLTTALAAAHDDVVKLGTGRSLAERPRTTCTICLIDEAVAQWAHVGDSRVYWLHDGTIAARTRDHSAVEALYQAGEISSADMLTHPLRNYVEECLGGEAEQPEWSIADPVTLSHSDVVLLCTDGFWSALKEDAIATYLQADTDLEQLLDAAVDAAQTAMRPGSDNVTAAALRWCE